MSRPVRQPPDGSFSFHLENTVQTRGNAGASTELVGFSTTISGLLRGDPAINSGSVATLTLDAANFWAVSSAAAACLQRRRITVRL
jgi:hypothetical protein